jgi:hypothetical protein
MTAPQLSWMSPFLFFHPRKSRFRAAVHGGEASLPRGAAISVAFLRVQTRNTGRKGRHLVVVVVVVVVAKVEIQYFDYVAHQRH